MCQLILFTIAMLFGQYLQQVGNSPLYFLLLLPIFFIKKKTFIGGTVLLALIMGSLQIELVQSRNRQVVEEISWYQLKLISTPKVGRRPGEMTFVAYLWSAIGPSGSPYRVRCSIRDLPWRNARFLERDGEYAVYARLRSLSTGRWDRYESRRGIEGRCQVYFLSQELSGKNSKTSFHGRQWFHRQLDGVISEGKAQAYLRAMLYGDTSGFTKHDKRLFQYWGISHLLVVSGLHVGALFLLTRSLISGALWIAFLLPGRYVLARYLPDLFGAWCAWWYVLQLELPVSATRAAIAVTLYALLPISGWKTQGLTKVLLAFLSIISLWPGVWEEVGFQLTFSAIFALLYAGYLRRRFQLSWWQNSLVATLCPTLSTSLVLYITIGGGSWLSLIGNIVFAPFLIIIGFYGGVITLLLSLCSFVLARCSGDVVATLLLYLHEMLVVVASVIRQDGFLLSRLFEVLFVALPAFLGLFLLLSRLWRDRNIQEPNRHRMPAQLTNGSLKE